MEKKEFDEVIRNMSLPDVFEAASHIRPPENPEDDLLWLDFCFKEVTYTLVYKLGHGLL